VKNRLQLAVMILVVSAVAVGSFFALYERVEETVPTAQSPAAIRNPYLAVQRLLEGRGYTVEWSATLSADELVDDRAVLWFSGDRLALQQRNAAVVDWMARGGRLVIGMGEDASEDDELIEEIEAEEEELDPLVGLLREREGDVPDELGRGTRLGPYEHEDESLTMHLAEVPDGDASLLFLCSEGDLLAKVGPFEQGRLGVLADVSRYTSEGLEDSGGGALLWDVLRSMDLPNRVLLVSSEHPPRLGAVLWGAGRPAIISGAVLLFVWLLYAAARFGPRLPPRSRQRRALLEHVAATGSLLWRQGAASVLLDAVRATVRRRITLSRAEWAFLQDEELAPMLAEVSGLSADEVLAALNASASDNPSTFARQITHLQHLRASLSGARRGT